jgi:hypothetical protein
MQGEAVASGSMHVDNIAPSLYGGLVLTVGIDHPRVKQIPVPGAIRAVIVHPHMFLSTRQARAILKGSVEMADFVWQTANLAGFISGCYTNDLDMLRECFEDVVIERQRAALIPGFGEVRRAALSAGAIGCSISGAGPTVFAWCLEQHAQRGACGHGARILSAPSAIRPLDHRGRSFRRARHRLMLFASTRNPLHRVGFSTALTQGLADDGGLYVPTDWPQLTPSSDADDLPALALELLRPLVAGDALAGNWPRSPARRSIFPRRCSHAR